MKVSRVTIQVALALDIGGNIVTYSRMKAGSFTWRLQAEEGSMKNQLLQGDLDAPFPYFGGKSKVADIVWQRLGDVPNYCEPFFGSGAVLLKRPHEPGKETINDKDGLLSNFWRSIQKDPEQTAYHADWPVIESDLHARHSWLVGQKESLQAKLEGDPEYYDSKIAGWWVWGISCWIGSGFCSGKGPWIQKDGLLVKKEDTTDGTWRQLVRLSGGKGVNRKRVSLRSLGAGVGVHRPTADIYAWFEALSERLKNVRVCCGDWTRILGPSPTWQLGLTGIFLDPPYDQTIRDTSLYNNEDKVSQAVREWALANGDNKLLRIVLCGYEGEHDMPDSWECYHWKAAGGYGGQGHAQGRENRDKERIWFSPHCLKSTSKQEKLF